ncbi:MAG: hypothetical protein AAFU67_10960, partial [Bacteroidota bacterium]
MRNLYFVVLFVLSFPLLGQEDTLQLSLPVVDIKAQRVQVTTTAQHLSKSAILESQTNNLAELLTQGSGVFIKNYGPGTLSTSSYRGGSASQTAVFCRGSPFQN